MRETTSISTTSRRLPVTSLATLGVLVGATSLLSSCVSDPDCGVCDPDKLVLEIMSGDNYSNDQIFLLSPECEGDKCPEAKKKGKYFVNQVLPCIEEEAAAKDGRPAEEYCKISPLITLGGLEFVFNNLLDPESIELVRKRPDDPSLFEIYEAKNRLAHIEGPTTRFNGDYLRGGSERPDISARSVNLACVEKLDAGVNGGWSGAPHDTLATDCTAVDWSTGEPLKMQTSTSDGDMPITTARAARTEWKQFSCSSPDEGPDTCCSVCDYELSVNVAKYGVSTPWDGAQDGESIVDAKNRFNSIKNRFSDAIACTSDGTGNKYVECDAFEIGVFRDDEALQYSYIWDGAEPQVYKLPRYDKLRETHPDRRPAGIEQLNGSCTNDQDCPSGAECIGDDGMGNACEMGATPGCTAGVCRQEWFVDCVADANTTGGQGYCIDKRFKDAGAGACYTADSSFTVTTSAGQQVQAPAGAKLSLCDTNENGFMNFDECCVSDLGGPMGAECDPLFSQNVTPIDRFERDQTLPNESRDCFCGPIGEQRDGDVCADQIEKFCAPPHGNGPVPEGNYITRFVTLSGGVVYDPALKGVNFLPADLGNYGRARVEQCAQDSSPIPRIGGRSILDGWRAGDTRGSEVREDFDRAMCSGSEYRVVFATGEKKDKGYVDEDGNKIQVLQDKVGNTLAGKDTYVFSTPEFHVVPRSGFPTDNIRIGGCDAFELSFSNKYDLEPTNLEKIQLWEVQRRPAGENGCDVPMDEFTNDTACWENKKIVAGGPNCTEDDRAAVDAGTAVPCLTVNVFQQFAGTVAVQIDPVIFGRKLFPEGIEGSTGRYRMLVPGLNRYDANMEATQTFESLDDLASKVTDEAERNAIYETAFHDACGMPLITAGMKPEESPDFLYDFSIDTPKCIEDEDLDGVQLSCDNAALHANPGQEDDDADGFGNIVDKCVLTAGSNNTDDTDRDGVGSACDNCRRATSFYNINPAATMMVSALEVRNNPRQTDSDQDGIGDSCDNCPSVPNCQSYGNTGGGLVPYELNDPIQDDNNNVCQTDNNMDMVGDSCEGQMPGMNAAGPIGTGLNDDFDQDGLPNVTDGCPRTPVAYQTCTTDAECPTGSACDPVGVCNHIDADGDTVGDVCDTCPDLPNFTQVLPGGAAEDDQDGDFVGKDCETNNECQNVIDPRPYSFYEVSVGGLCCTTTYPGDGFYQDDPMSATGFTCYSPENGGTPNGIMCDPDGLPITATCANEPAVGQDPIPDGTLCRKLPSRVVNRPGVIDMPEGCDEALMAAGITEAENVQLSLEDVSGPVELWSKMCFLPQWDQDFDGLGDACDLCKFAFDPRNERFVSEATGQVFPNAGRYCNGSYDIENSPKCTQKDDGTGGTGTGTGTGGTGG